MIVEALRDLGRPVGAYELMDRLREKVSTLAPPTVYRSLDRLVAGGRAHRLHSLNAFIACRHLSHKGAAVFAICEDCGSATEIDEQYAVQRLKAWAEKTKFAISGMTLELRGRCGSCARSR